MWCDLGKSVGTQTCDIFSFLFDWSAHLQRYILLKTPPESDQWFQGYEQLKILRTIENNRNSFPLVVYQNQYCRLPTDPARSQHISLTLNIHAPISSKIHSTRVDMQELSNHYQNIIEALRIINLSIIISQLSFIASKTKISTALI